MLLRSLLALFILVFAFYGLVGAQPRSQKPLRKIPYPEISIEDMLQRYLDKEPTTDDLEGIYSVSCVITKKSTPFLSKREREKVVERKDNYARVAIMRNKPSNVSDYIEVSMSYRDPSRYPIVGELTRLAEGRGVIYKHVEPNAATVSFSMTIESSDLIDGEYSVVDGKRTVTYRLSYLKIYPKAGGMTARE